MITAKEARELALSKLGPSLTYLWIQKLINEAAAEGKLKSKVDGKPEAPMHPHEVQELRDLGYSVYESEIYEGTWAISW